MNITENTLECLESNFKELVLSNGVISLLFQAMCMQHAQHNRPAPFGGNFYAFADIMSEEWLYDRWEEYEDEAKLGCPVSLKDKVDWLVFSVISELKELVRVDFDDDDDVLSELSPQIVWDHRSIDRA